MSMEAGKILRHYLVDTLKKLTLLQKGALQKTFAFLVYACIASPLAFLLDHIDKYTFLSLIASYISLYDVYFTELPSDLAISDVDAKSLA